MCGRYTLTTSAERLARWFQLDDTPPPFEGYNISPTQSVPVVRIDPTTIDHKKRQMIMLHWGMIPFWAKNHTIGNRLINARSEHVADKPSFKNAFRKRRCLVVADGFYEWQKRGSHNQPYLVRMANQEPYAFAGLWEHWNDPQGNPIESCTIMTTGANELMKPIHHRMPVIVDPIDYDHWLDPQSPGPFNLLQPYPPNLLTAVAVSTHVNNPHHDDPACLQPDQLF